MKVGRSVLSDVKDTGYREVATKDDILKSIELALLADKSALFWVSIAQISGDVRARIDQLPSVKQREYRSRISEIENRVDEPNDDILGEMLIMQAELMEQTSERIINYPVDASYMRKMMNSVNEMYNYLMFLNTQGLVTMDEIKKYGDALSSGTAKLTEYSPEQGYYYLDRDQYEFLSQGFQLGVIDAIHRKLEHIKESLK